MDTKWLKLFWIVLASREGKFTLTFGVGQGFSNTISKYIQDHSKNMNGRLLIAAIFCLQIMLTYSLCPSECSKDCEYNSSSITFKCVHCLQNYFRVFNFSSGDCDCMETFREMLPPKDACCPKNCSICASYGCASCRNDWTLGESAMSSQLGVQVCLCVDNFYYDPQRDDCFCKSYLVHEDYYFLYDDNLCRRCPLNCSCDDGGCIYCQESANRVITVYEKIRRLKYCDCRPPLIDVNGTCMCTKGCSCTNETTWCDLDQTHRFLNISTQKYECSPPYKEVDGWCECPSNYVQISKFQNTSKVTCVCRSRTEPTKYYLFDGECRTCPIGCICNNYGCYKCNPATHRIAYGGQCPCQFPFTQDSFGSCLCLEPYYLNNSGSCNCLSEVYPKLFVFDTGSNPKCYPCPDSCECDETGCISCLFYKKKVVTQFEDGHWSCLACEKKSFEYPNLRCVCTDFDNEGNCMCPPLTSYMDKRGLCVKCPKGCNCTYQGCHYCKDIANRQIIVEPDGSITCPCKQGTAEGGEGYCVCHTTYDSFTTQCPCSGFYAQINGVCKCLAAEDPVGFYWDRATDQCYPCPVGCVCNEMGCFDCEPDSLRWNYINLTTRISHCPCIQSALLYKGECIKCPLGQYYTSGGCITCSNCTTCNKLGCSSCPQGMHLEKYHCICNDPATANVNGKCTCPPGTYQQNNSENFTCVLCPKNCQQCILLTTNIIGCTVCPVVKSRYNDPYNNCPCISGYKQSAHLEQYCCEMTCGTCNETGCTSCSPATYRVLTGQNCTCINNLNEYKSENGALVCRCWQTQYLVFDKCHTCPKNCRTCQYNYTTKSTNCLSCRVNTFRDISSNCSCLPTYVESNPVQYNCKPVYCKDLYIDNIQNGSVSFIQCRECVENMQPIADKTNCQCIQGYFMNLNGYCTSCTMVGCKNCSSINICNYCDKYKGYYLTGSTCKHDINISDYIYTQSQTGIIVQFKADVGYLLLVQGQLQRVKNKLNPDEPIEKPIQLTTLNYSLEKPSVICVRFSHPNITYFNYTLAITYQYEQRRQLQANNTTTVVSFEKTVYIRRPIFYSQSKTKVNDRGQYQVELAMTVVVMVFCLAMYLKGFKHNQIPFFLQTLAFIGYIIQDEKFNIATYLYNLRWSYYDFGNALSGIIPDYYLQTAKGNFPFFTIDSNIFRVCGTTLLIAVINLGAVVVLRSFYFLLNNTPLRNCTRLTQTVRLNKKPIYRIIEFLYKTTMYPLLFFTFITYRHWDANILVAKSGYHNFCHILAIALVIIYFFVTMWQFYIEVISKLNKVQDASEFVFAVLAAMIIAISTHKKSYVALVAVFIGKGLVFLISRRILLRDFQPIQYLKILSVAMEITTILVLIADSPAATVVLSILTIVLQYTHEVAVVFLTDKDAKLAKMNDSTEVNVSTSKITQITIMPTE